MGVSSLQALVNSFLSCRRGERGQEGIDNRKESNVYFQVSQDLKRGDELKLLVDNNWNFDWNDRVIKRVYLSEVSLLGGPDQVL